MNVLCKKPRYAAPAGVKPISVASNRVPKIRHDKLGKVPASLELKRAVKFARDHVIIYGSSVSSFGAPNSSNCSASFSLSVTQQYIGTIKRISNHSQVYDRRMLLM